MGLFAKDTTKNTTKKPVKTEAKKAAVKDTDASMKDLYKKKTDAKAVVEKTKSGKAFSFALSHNILVRPLVTEKSAHLVSENKYIFVVSDKANKITVAKAIEDIFKVKPIKVNILSVNGKIKQRGKIVGKRKDWKKAVVTLAKGQTIDVYEGV